MTGFLARLGVVVLGAWVGVLGAVVHRMTADVGALRLPWGLALALLAVVLGALACEQLVRVGGAWFGLGWTLVLLLQQVQTSGSYLVAGDALGWTFMAGGLAGCAGVVVLAGRTGR